MHALALCARGQAFVEGVDIDELEAARTEDQAHMDAELAQQNEDLAQINREVGSLLLSSPCCQKLTSFLLSPRASPARG